MILIFLLDHSSQTNPTMRGPSIQRVLLYLYPDADKNKDSGHWRAVLYSIECGGTWGFCSQGQKRT